jgi:hypothetical protein
MRSEKTGVNKVINLSTIGGHLDRETVLFFIGAHHVENILNKLSNDVSITHIHEFYTTCYR